MFLALLLPCAALMSGLWPSMPRQISLAVIPGDGVGPEVIAEAMKVLSAATEPVAVNIVPTFFPFGVEHYRKTAQTLTDDDLAALACHDAILLGAVGGVPGDPELKNANIERGLLLKLRFAFDHYVNLRPTVIYPGLSRPLTSAGEVDFVVVREGTEGPYVGNGGAIRVDTQHEVATEVSLNTAFGVERVVRFAFQTADSRPRKKLTLVHKTNVLAFAGSLWQRTVDRVSAEFAEVEVDYLHVDAATIFFVTDPARFDTIVTDNLFGDILTDLAAAISGGIGLAASANINPEGTFPSMFEPVHGSAPDIAGKQIADPTAAILSAAMLLEQQGLPDVAANINRAVRRDISQRNTMVRSTSEIGDAIVSALRTFQEMP